MISWQCNAYSYQCIAVNTTLSGSRGAIFIVDLSVGENQEPFIANKFGNGTPSDYKKISTTINQKNYKK